MRTRTFALMISGGVLAALNACGVDQPAQSAANASGNDAANAAQGQQAASSAGDPSPPPAPPAAPEPSVKKTGNKNTDRFLELWTDVHKLSNGYFSPEGIPYHAVETLVVEAPDYGHETTSEAYSYWIWLEAMY